MLIRIKRGASTFDLLLREPGMAKLSGMKFANDDDLANFLTPLLNAPENHGVVSNLRRELFGESTSSTIRLAGKNPDGPRRFAYAFRSQGGIILNRTPKSAGGTASGSAAPPPVSVAPPPKPAPLRSSADSFVPITEFKITKVFFESSHHKLKNYDKDWKNQGTPIKEYHWRPGDARPITHTKGTKTKIRVTLQAGPPNASPDRGVLAGYGHLDYETPQPRTVSPGENEFILESKEALENSIDKLVQIINWQLRLDKSGTLDGGTTQPHVIYLTYDTPQDDQAATVREDGVTVKRIEAAVGLAGQLVRHVSFDLLDRLFDLCPRYTLAASSTIPKTFKHPHYKNFEGGSWAILQYRNSGECQAIVRLVNGLLRQLGVPGKSEMLCVYAKPEKPMEATTDPIQGRGLGRSFRKVGEGFWEAGLTDKPVKLGQKCLPDHTLLNPKTGERSVGFNSYEAILRFTEILEPEEGKPKPEKPVYGQTRIYAGGAAQKTSIQDTLVTCFYQLVWFERVSDPVHGRVKIIREIAATYRLDEGGSDAAV